MRVFTSLFTALIVMMIATTNVQADIVLSVETDPVAVEAGESAFITVFASSTEAAGELVQAFNFPIDVGGDGANLLPTGISLNADPIQNEIDGLLMTPNLEAIHESCRWFRLYCELCGPQRFPGSQHASRCVRHRC